jgi:hypothetical protein
VHVRRVHIAERVPKRVRRTWSTANALVRIRNVVVEQLCAFAQLVQLVLVFVSDVLSNKFFSLEELRTVPHLTPKLGLLKLLNMILYILLEYAGKRQRSVIRPDEKPST